MNDLALALVAGGFGLLGGGITALIAFLAANHNRKSAVREQAYAKAVDACADFVGCSHLFLSKKVELVTALDSIKRNHPELEYLGGALDREMLSQTFFPAIERNYTTWTRAESLAPTKSCVDLIRDMVTAQEEANPILEDAMHGNFVEDWKDRLDAITKKHDAASQELTEHLRAVGAETSYREFAPGRIVPPDRKP